MLYVRSSSSIAELIADNSLDFGLSTSAIDQGYLKPDNKDNLVKETGINSRLILRKMMKRWLGLFE